MKKIIFLIFLNQLSLTSPCFATGEEAVNREIALAEDSVGLQRLDKAEADLNSEMAFFDLYLRNLALNQRKPSLEDLRTIKSFEKRKANIDREKTKILDLDGSHARKKAEVNERARQANLALARARSEEELARSIQKAQDDAALALAFASLPNSIPKQSISERIGKFFSGKSDPAQSTATTSSTSSYRTGR